MEHLIGGGYIVNQKDDNGQTPAHIAAKYDRPATLRVLHSLGADMTAVDNDGRTPADIADEAKNAAVIGVIEEIFLSGIKPAGRPDMKSPWFRPDEAQQG